MGRNLPLNGEICGICPPMCVRSGPGGGKTAQQEREPPLGKTVLDRWSEIWRDLLQIWAARCAGYVSTVLPFCGEHLVLKAVVLRPPRRQVDTEGER